MIMAMNTHIALNMNFFISLLLLTNPILHTNQPYSFTQLAGEVTIVVDVVRDPDLVSELFCGQTKAGPDIFSYTFFDCFADMVVGRRTPFSEVHLVITLGTKPLPFGYGGVDLVVGPNSSIIKLWDHFCPPGFNISKYILVQFIWIESIWIKPISQSRGLIHMGVVMSLTKRPWRLSPRAFRTQRLRPSLRLQFPRFPEPQRPGLQVPSEAP